MYFVFDKGGVCDDLLTQASLVGFFFTVKEENPNKVSQHTQRMTTISW